MKNKLLKILFLAMFGCTSFYLFRSWKANREKISFDVDAFEFSQTQLDIAELLTSFPKPIWFIKTDSSVICLAMVFKNEGDRSFHSTPGILDVVIGTLIDGAGSRDGIALKKALDEKNISINIANDNDDITITVSCLKKHFEFAVDLLCDIMSKAHLKREKLEIAKQGAIICMQQSKFSTDGLALEKLSNLIYVEGHPYRWTYEGIIKAIQKYSKSDADKCYASIFNPKNAIITFTGNIDSMLVTAACEKLYKATVNKNNDFKDGQQRTDLKNYGKVAHVELDNPQATILIALNGISRTSANRFASKLANIGFGGCGFSSRLQKRLRDKDGLVYRINTGIVDRDLQSYVVVTAKTRPENVTKAIKAIKEECREFFENGLTQKELDAFKTYICADGDLVSNADKALFANQCRVDNVPLKDINSYLQNYFDLKLEEVNTAIKAIFNPNKSIVVSCGKSNQKSSPVKCDEEEKGDEEEKK
jgi:predicted Zn-dependent peptidase